MSAAQTSFDALMVRSRSRYGYVACVLFGTLVRVADSLAPSPALKSGAGFGVSLGASQHPATPAASADCRSTDGVHRSTTAHPRRSSLVFRIDPRRELFLQKVPIHRQFPDLAMQHIWIGPGIRVLCPTTTLEYRRPVLQQLLFPVLDLRRLNFKA